MRATGTRTIRVAVRRALALVALASTLGGCDIVEELAGAVLACEFFGSVCSEYSYYVCDERRFFEEVDCKASADCPEGTYCDGHCRCD